MKMREGTYCEYVHSEYTAMAARVDAYSTGTFDDFKLFAALGALLAWKPIADSFGGSENTPIVLFLGFLAIAAVVVIMEARSLLKLSLIRYYMERLHDIETEMIELSPIQSTKAFNIAHCWDNWYEKIHRPIGKLYHAFLYGTIVFLPMVIIVFSYKSLFLAFLYGVITATLCIKLHYAALALTRK